jgi:hypothetical protein
MSRHFLALGLALALAACGGSKSPPTRLDNACAIVDERPQYLRAMRRAERKWGVPVPVQMAVIHQESKFDGDAETPYRWALGVIPLGRVSTAYGYSQALDGTWDSYKDATGQRRARRDRIRDATDFMGWYMNETQSRLGIPLYDARRQYLAYHDGWTGYARGSYRAKGWLLNVSDRVASRAKTYEAQLRACRRL